MSYATQQAIREMAGVQLLKKKEVPTGVVDGANANFYATNVPIVDTSYSDSVSATDVLAFVDEAAVTVQSINATTGLVTLATAPSPGSVVKLTYSYSSVSDARVDAVANEASEWLNGRISTAFPNYDGVDFTAPAIFSTITTLFAAGLILIRDYGSSVDTDLSSKDGYKKLAMARELLGEYLGDIADDSSATDAVSGVMQTDGEIFARSTDLTSDHSHSADDEFFRKDC